MPVIDVTCITHRNDPIMVGSAIGLAPVAEEQVITMAAGTSAVLRNALEESKEEIIKPKSKEDLIDDVMKIRELKRVELTLQHLLDKDGDE